MNDNTHRSYEQAVTPEGAATQQRIIEGKFGEADTVRIIEQMLPDLATPPMVQPASTYSPEVQAAVTDLAQHRQRSAADDARAAVYAIHQGNGYGRAA